MMLENCTTCRAKFQYGVGTQVMLKSFIQTPPRELLHDRARRLLEDDEVEELKKRLDKVRELSRTNMFVC